MSTAKEPPRAFIVGSWTDDRQKDGSFTRYSRLFERLTTAIAWMLPRPLVKWCAIRVMAHATTGKWGHEITPALLATDALKRWDQP